MKHYLVVYDRVEGTIIKHKGFRDASRALRARFDAERDYRGQGDVEVVVLGAESWDSLPQTHARYFKGVQELAASAISLAPDGSY